MRWVRQNAEWMGLTFALASGFAALYVRDAMASTKERISVLEALFPELKDDLNDIKQAQAETQRDVKKLLQER